MPARSVGEPAGTLSIFAANYTAVGLFECVRALVL